MPSFSDIEKKLGRLLDSYPKLKSMSKYIFQRTNYAIFRNRHFHYSIDNRATIADISIFANVTKKGVTSEFFGYYDKTPWSGDMRYFISHRQCPDDSVEVIVYDTKGGEEKILGSSRAWNFQQGAMSQWLPGEDHAVIFNAIDSNNNLISRMVWLTGKESTCPWPVQIIHPSGKSALTLNYKRLFKIRPEYGYAAKVANFSCSQPLQEDGIWMMDFASGQGNLIVRLSDLIDISPKPEMQGANHKVNHLLYSPSGRHFVFMHRWQGKRGKFSRLYVADEAGKNLKILMDERMVSHYCWQDEDHVFVWGRTEKYGDHYYLIDINSGNYDIIGQGRLDVFGDGHPSFSPDRQWLVTDTYPDRARQRHLLLYSIGSDQAFDIGQFFSPFRYDGPNRCDLHPRWSPDGKCVSIDSVHTGYRRSYVIDISNIL